MSRCSVLRLFVLVVFVLATMDSWVYLFQCSCYENSNQGRSDQLAGVTDVERDPVVSALRDAMPSSVGDAKFECRKLFGGDARAHGFAMSADFRENVGEFLAAVNSSVVGPGRLEGNSFQLETEYRLLHYLARRLDFVRTVCETGFNAGHSSFNFLTARPDVKVHSFDLARHQYVEPMVGYLERKFPGRLHVELGDSRQTVPRYFAVNSTSLSCDIALVDGGHGFDVALSDMRNLARVASYRQNVLIVDDVNTRQVRSAWRVALRSDDIQHLFTCTYGKQGRAFAVGVVSRNEKYSNIINGSGRSSRKSRWAVYWTAVYCSIFVCLSIVVVTAVLLLVLYA